ncbi:MAG: Aspartate racemase [Parcubacteria group bacterium GW2011_GWC2_39_14]|nr:MAG: Aspartate racemase [Parcubacteria group bacterium GW2011_GWC2_39_14]KKR55042.1 MAG: Aspartate racemase [Parcubacteria group bacterium GW2011_GWA2_40_23]
MKQNKPITIGILAGMGPKSTAPFLELLVEECQKQYGAKNDIDFPHMIIYSLPTPFFVDQAIDDNRMEKIILAGLKKLERFDVDFIAMPCNSAHKYFPKLKANLSTPLLNIVDATATRITKNTKRVTLLATTKTNETKLYQNKLKRKGIEVILKDEWQLVINNLITSVKAGSNSTRLSGLIKKLFQKFAAEHVDTLIIACTELTKLFKNVKGFTVIDSSHALAEETIKNYKIIQYRNENR